MHPIPRRNFATLLATSLALAACGGSGVGLDQNGRPITSGSPGSGVTADFKSIQDNVFTPICTVCHSGATAPQGLRLDAANSYANLVNVNSSEAPSVKRVAPGNPNASYLIQKLRGSGSAFSGVRMPLGGPYLSDDTINTIAQWIQNGAPSSVAPNEEIMLHDMHGVSVATSAPMNGDVVTVGLRQMVVAFDRELDVNLVNSTTVVLERLDTHTQIPATLSVPVANPSSLLIDLEQPLTNGAYRLILRGTGGGALAGLNAVPLNSLGDFSGGQDTSIAFTVEVQK